MLWHQESPDPERPPEQEWLATLRRIRSEFNEMPCVRLTIEQARAFFGLNDHAAARALLEQLAQEGFLARTDEGEYMRRIARP